MRGQSGTDDKDFEAKVGFIPQLTKNAMTQLRLPVCPGIAGREASQGPEGSRPLNTTWKRWTSWPKAFK
jgi:hypothetical protein